MHCKPGPAGSFSRTPSQQLVHAIRVVSQGDAVLAPSVTRRLLARFAPHEATTQERARLSRLTDREVEVLQMIATGMSNAEIGAAMFLSEATVKTHVGRVLSKLACRDRTQAAVFAFRSGIMHAN